MTAIRLEFLGAVLIRGVTTRPYVSDRIAKSISFPSRKCESHDALFAAGVVSGRLPCNQDGRLQAEEEQDDASKAQLHLFLSAAFATCDRALAIAPIRWAAHGRDGHSAAAEQQTHGARIHNTTMT